MKDHLHLTFVMLYRSVGIFLLLLGAVDVCRGHQFGNIKGIHREDTPSLQRQLKKMKNNAPPIETCYADARRHERVLQETIVPTGTMVPAAVADFVFGEPTCELDCSYSCLGTTGRAFGPPCDEATAAIGKGACVGDDACTAVVGDIGDYACVGDLGTCEYLQGTVGTMGCIGFAACSFATGEIGDYACQGELACIDFAGQTEELACRGLYVCDDGSGQRGFGSCQGQSACSESSNTDIGCNSCISPWACYKTNALEVGSKSCTDVNSCPVAASSSIGDESCTVYAACNNIGGSKIGDGSCLATDSCRYVRNITIGDNSCLAEAACLGLETDVDKNACQCADCCACPDPKGTGKKVKSGQCNVPGECCRVCPNPTTLEFDFFAFGGDGVNYVLRRSDPATTDYSTVDIRLAGEVIRNVRSPFYLDMFATSVTENLGCLDLATYCYSFGFFDEFGDFGGGANYTITAGSVIVTQPDDRNLSKPEYVIFGNCPDDARRLQSDAVATIDTEVSGNERGSVSYEIKVGSDGNTAHITVAANNANVTQLQVDLVRSNQRDASLGVLFNDAVTLGVPVTMTATVNDGGFHRKAYGVAITNNLAEQVFVDLYLAIPSADPMQASSSGRPPPVDRPAKAAQVQAFLVNGTRPNIPDLN